MNMRGKPNWGAIAAMFFWTLFAIGVLMQITEPAHAGIPSAAELDARGLCANYADLADALYTTKGEELYAVRHVQGVEHSFWYNPYTYTWTWTIRDWNMLCVAAVGQSAGPLSWGGAPLEPSSLL